MATIYELRHPTPMLTGPGAASVTALGPREIEGWTARPGSYLLRLHFTPYWSVARGSVCVARARGALTRIEASRAGPFAIRAIETPGRILTAILDRDSPPCGVPKPPHGSH